MLSIYKQDMGGYVQQSEPLDDEDSNVGIKCLAHTEFQYD